MGDELRDAVRKFVGGRWDVRRGRVVPFADAICLGNAATELKKATILYADLAHSTKIVDALAPEIAAAIYKSFLYCASRIIAGEGGEITGFDGDRVMGVFLGDGMESSAAKAALKINGAMKQIVLPSCKEAFPELAENAILIRHGIGIDASPVFAARIGTRTANDVVWVGRAANYAAKLAAMRGFFTVNITGPVLRRLEPNVRRYDGDSIWKPAQSEQLGIPIHRTRFVWEV